MEKPYLKVRKIKESAIIPSKREEDAGYDVYGVFEKDPYFIYPGEIYLVPLGISIEFPKDYVFYIVERSGAGSKGISTRAGVIDSGYRGEIKTPLNNVTDKLQVFTNLSEDELRDKHSEMLKGFEEDLVIYPQTKAIAQGLLLYCPHVEVEEAEELDISSSRGEGGFGSSGK